MKLVKEQLWFSCHSCSSRIRNNFEEYLQTVILSLETLESPAVADCIVVSEILPLHVGPRARVQLPSN